MRETQIKGRDREATEVRRILRAVAVGKLMSRELKDWKEFLEPDLMELESLPRRQLKIYYDDARKRISKIIKGFCSKYFLKLTIKSLDTLYERIKAHRGLELPLKEFEECYSKINPSVIKDFPPHSTVVISLWGLQFKFPEDYLAKDLFISLNEAFEVHHQLSAFEKKAHPILERNKGKISLLIRKSDHAVRSSLLCCFNLMEAYLNGIAWDFAQDKEKWAGLSKTKKELLEDKKRASLRNKILKYPQIVTGKSLWDEKDDDVTAFLELIKPFRDSLVHPSPFSVPEKFGGYDKLEKLYRYDLLLSLLTAKITCTLIARIHQHLNDIPEGHPIWLNELMELVNECVVEKPTFCVRIPPPPTPSPNKSSPD